MVLFRGSNSYHSHTVVIVLWETVHHSGTSLFQTLPDTGNKLKWDSLLAGGGGGGDEVLIYQPLFLNKEVSSFQGVGSTVNRGILILRGGNRGVPLYTEVSSFQGVGIEGFHCIQRCPHFKGLE